MNIEEEKLQKLLESKKKHIKTREYLLVTILSLVSFITSLLLSGFWNGSLFVRIAILICSIIYLVIFIFSVYGSNYSPEALYRDICSTSIIHNFSLLIMKNNKGQFLLKYNKRWKCYLFPFTKTIENKKEVGMIEFCKSTLNMDQVEIINHTEEDITKRSISADLIKTYHHDFYIIKCEDKLQSKSKFKINKEKYKWFSIEEMKCNKNIYNKNSETIEYVESHF